MRVREDIPLTLRFADKSQILAWPQDKTRLFILIQYKFISPLLHQQHKMVAAKKVSSGHISEEVEDGIQLLPKMEISKLTFLLQASPESSPEVKPKLLKLIEENGTSSSMAS